MMQTSNYDERIARATLAFWQGEDYMLSDYTLNKETPIPLYFQLKTLILDRIKDGTYCPGDLIPTENELSAMFDISRTTVRQAVTELVREGYLKPLKEKYPGKNIIVRPKHDDLPELIALAQDFHV